MARASSVGGEAGVGRWLWERGEKGVSAGGGVPIAALVQSAPLARSPSE